MGINNSKPNTLIAPAFDGQTSDYTTDATTYTHPYGPEWAAVESDLTKFKKEFAELDTFDKTKVPPFTFKGTVVPAYCVKVYDGDTAHFVMKYNGTIVKYRFRMIGYNSPEIRGVDDEERAKGLAARDYLADRLLNKKVLLYLGDFDKYGRPLCDIYLIDDEKNMTLANMFNNHLNSEMIKMGHGIPYNGKRSIDDDVEDRFD